MSYIGNAPISAAFLVDTFSGTGSQTAFTMTVAPANTSSIIVAITGVLQDPSTYSVSGTTLTFSAAPPSGTSNISVRYLGIPASGVTTTAYRTVTEFTATSGQTSFSVPSYTVGYIDVYRNGVMLGTADFTATTGTTVVLATGATTGDLIRTESFYVSSVLNAIPATAGAVAGSYLAGGAVTLTTQVTGILPVANGGTGLSAGGPAFSAYLGGSTQSINSGSFTKVTFDTETFDTNNNFASNRFTPTVAGYYQLNTNILFNSIASGVICIVAIYKNGGNYARGNGGYLSNTSGDIEILATTLAYANGTTDYFEVYVYQNSGSAKTVYNDAGLTSFNGCLVRSA
jgi:hypothetical protein